jgi:hypothetical protein
LPNPAGRVIILLEKTVDDEIAEIVREHGWFAADVNDGNPAFMYTIGLMQTCSHPEIIVFGLHSPSAYALLATLFDDIRAGRSFAEPGVYTLSIGNDQHRVGFRHVDETQHPLYLGFAMGFMRNLGRIGELEAVQAFWPDKDGKFPFDAGCDYSVYEAQPRLDIALTPSEIRRWEKQWE